MTAALSWQGDARAACPSHERVNAILRALESREPLRGLRADLTMQDAECGRRRLVEKLQSAANPVVGYKAGLTNAKIQAQFGASRPVRGVLLENMLLPDGVEVPARFGARPVLEADLLVRVTGEPLPEVKTPAGVLQTLVQVMPFIELPDLGVAQGEKLSAPLITFLNVGARLGVVGKPIRVEATQAFADALANLRVVVTDQDGRELARGSGAAILGHPLNAVMWLHEDLARGRVRLKPGDVLSLGSFTPPLAPKAGTTVTVRYEGLPGNPTVSVRFN
ncbi:MAG TPA: fumarylacetoacetate hydrolase [Burkholderiales bacterium]